MISLQKYNSVNTIKTVTWKSLLTTKCKVFYSGLATYGKQIDPPISQSSGRKNNSKEPPASKRRRRLFSIPLYQKMSIPPVKVSHILFLISYASYLNKDLNKEALDTFRLSSLSFSVQFPRRIENTWKLLQTARIVP